MDIVKDVVEYIVGALVAWNIWATKEIYELKKDMALNSQNDQSVKGALIEFKGSIEKLTAEISQLKIDMAKHWKEDKN
jgi:hypothetical protein